MYNLNVSGVIPLYPCGSAPVAWHQTPISPWLASILIVPVLRNDRCGGINCSIQGEVLVSLVLLNSWATLCDEVPVVAVSCKTSVRVVCRHRRFSDVLRLVNSSSSSMSLSTADTLSCTSSCVKCRISCQHVTVSQPTPTDTVASDDQWQLVTLTVMYRVLLETWLPHLFGKLWKLGETWMEKDWEKLESKQKVGGKIVGFVSSGKSSFIPTIILVIVLRSWN